MPTAQERRIIEAMYGGGIGGTGGVVTSGGGSADSTKECKSEGVTFGKLMIPSVLFFALGMPFVDKFISGKISAPTLIILAIKTGLFMLILVVMQLIGF